jgi:PAS domain S-box-containing protein
MGMFDSFQDLFFIVDRAGLVLHANNTAYAKLGKEDATLDGKSILELYEKENQSEITKILKSVKQGEVIKLDIPLIAAVGSKIQANTRVVMGKYSGEDVVFMVSREILS